MILCSKPLIMFAACCLANFAIMAESIGQSQKPNTLWLEQLTRPIRNGQARIEPAASCASTACHGGPRAGVGVNQAVRGSEYPLWLQSDPHAQSWRTLCSDESVKVLERLKIFREGKIVDQAAFDNCLACHNTTTNQNHEFQAEGVGCASCHGPSEKWRSDHYRVQRDDLSSSQCGMVPNKNLLARARTCAACHIGDSDRDMNHDIIAAGHPALHYEFVTYHNMLPKHWREPASEDFEAQLWLAGQIASLDASLALLEARAAQRLKISVWPEFAASDCSACHQNFRITTEDYAAPVRASARFSSWNRFGLEQLLKLERIEKGENAIGEGLALNVSNMSELMRAGGIENRMEAAQGARSARLALDIWLKSSNGQVQTFTASRLQHLAAAAMRDQSEFGHWEFIAQSYLAAIASRQSWSNNEFAVAEAQRLRKGLLFKPSTSLLCLADEPNRNVKDAVAIFANLLESNQNPVPPPIREPQELQLELVPAPLTR